MNQLSNPHKSVFYAENILKGILLLALFITPLIYSSALYMPYVAGKAYLFRLLVGIALIPWVVLLFRKPDIRPNFRNPLVIALLIMLFILIITAITGVDIRRSFFSNTERSDGIIQYAYWILFFLMFISIFKTKKDWQIIFSIFIFTALINCIYGFAHFSSQPRLFGLFGNSSFLAGFLIFAIGFCLLFLFKRFKPFTEKTPIWFVFLVVALVLFFATTLFLTQTRGAYLGVLLGFIIFSVLSSIYFWRKSKRTFVVLTTILFVVLASLILMFVFRESQFIKRMPIVYRVANITHTTSVQDRLSQWSTAITAFKERPILGWGPETFDIVTNKYYDYKIGIYEPWFDRPHNQAFQYLAEGGIVLFGAYLFLVAMVFRLIFKIFKKEKILGSLLFAIYIGYIIQSLILFDAFPMFLGLFVLLALIYYLQTESSPAVVSGLP